LLFLAAVVAAVAAYIKFSLHLPRIFRCYDLQECREKDEQLVRFQHELVQLVNALRHWKQQSQVSIAMDTSGASVPLYV
jgi:hypothetical protein